MTGDAGKIYDTSTNQGMLLVMNFDSWYIFYNSFGCHLISQLLNNTAKIEANNNIIECDVIRLSWAFNPKKPAFTCIPEIYL